MSEVQYSPSSVKIESYYYPLYVYLAPRLVPSSKMASIEAKQGSDIFLGIELSILTILKVEL